MLSSVVGALGPYAFSLVRISVYGRIREQAQHACTGRKQHADKLKGWEGGENDFEGQNGEMRGLGEEVDVPWIKQKNKIIVLLREEEGYKVYGIKKA